MGDGALGETLIPAINKLQDIFSQVTIDFRLDLPQVAVVGSQSSGKSSVLEALVGRDFLPRGPEICTRRPLLLQLVKQAAGSGKAAEWGEFLHCPGKRFYDFERIRQEILTETERTVGHNKGISDKPIRLKIYSPNVLTMTLVDLPGIAKVPVGDQPSDIEKRIRKMVLEYIRHPTCVILAVSAANADLVNSDALELARAADPEGRRTVGVLTKLDIMDRGTDASAILRNEVVPLRLGYIGMVNRSQADINTRRSIRDAIAAETAFFEQHPAYQEVKEQCGRTALSRSLNRVLVEHIRASLPTLRTRLEEALEKCNTELRIYGDAPPGQTNAARGALLLQLLDSYAVRYSEMLDGRSEHLPVNELAGGARIRHIFLDIFVNGLQELNPSSELTDDDVRTAIKNSGGVRGSLLIPDAPFELLVRRAISRLLTPSLQCKEFVHAELLRIAAQCAPPDIARFPKLKAHLISEVEEFVNSGASPAERMIRDVIDCEHSYINTDHPNFIGGSRAIAQVMERRQAAAEEAEEQNSEGSGRDARNHHRAPGHLVDGHHTHSSSVPNLRHTGDRLYDGALQPKSNSAKAVEPELFAPEDLLEARAGAGPSLLALEAPEPSPAAGHTAHKWFSNWFGSNHEGPSENGNDSPLPQPPFTLRVPTSITEQEEVQVEVTRLLVECYFDIVRANLQDAVPKAVMHFLVLRVQRGLQQHLIKTLYREDLFKDMMSEREDVAAKRNKCLGAQQAFREALAALEALPQQLIALTGRTVSQALPTHAAAWSEPAHIAQSSTALPGASGSVLPNAGLRAQSNLSNSPLRAPKISQPYQSPPIQI
ncbi:Dynamin-related protein DNM1 [Coccomyxa sp. Obi]|nr:Dynamin-related protein DNM1 [Coccomyxa sp. Obi]